jgi:peptide/nickel transport system substrate-binding protein
MVYAFLNTRRAPFDDLRVRQAVNLALDRRTLLQSGIPNCQVLPRGFTGYERYCPFPYDLERARRLVAESGTKGAKVKVWSPDGKQAVALMKGVVRTMKSLGYRARLHVVPQSVHFPIVQKKHKQAGFWGWDPDFPSTAAVIPPLLGCDQGVNLSRFCNRRLDAKMRRAGRLQATDPIAAGKLWAEIDRKLTDQAPWVSSTTLPEKVFVSERVGNFQHNPQWGVLLDQLWVR